jgi:hypothetical protein
MKHLIKRVFVIVLSLGIVNASMLQVAHAELIPTENVSSIEVTQKMGLGHARLSAALTRADVRAEMERLGVSPAVAAERVAALTDAEAGRLADQIDNAPAGGIVGVILLVFFVLLFTDIMGWTKVFPFTRTAR